MTESSLTRARRKTITAPAARDLLHTMATAMDQGNPDGTAAHWAALEKTPVTQTTKSLERLIQAGHATKQWDPNRYTWTYRAQL